MSEGQPQPEGNLPKLHQSLSEDTTRFIQQSEHSTATMLRVYQLQREQPQHYLTICKSVQESVNRAVLTAVAETNQAEYKDIQRYTEASKRTIRKRLNELEENRIIEKRNSGILTVAFASEDTALLVKDALSMFYDTM